MLGLWGRTASLAVSLFPDSCVLCSLTVGPSRALRRDVAPSRAKELLDKKKCSCYLDIRSAPIRGRRVVLNLSVLDTNMITVQLLWLIMRLDGPRSTVFPRSAPILAETSTSTTADPVSTKALKSDVSAEDPTCATHADGGPSTADTSEPSLKSPLREDDAFSADSGSTTTEDAFPGEPRERFGSGGEDANGGGSESGGSGGTMPPNGLRVSPNSSATDASVSAGETGEKKMLSAISSAADTAAAASRSVYAMAEEALALAAAAAGGAPPEPPPASHPLLHEVSVSIEAGDGFESQTSQREFGSGPTALSPPATAAAAGSGHGVMEGSVRAVTCRDGDPAVSRALAEAAQAEAEIEAAEAADREAARLRVRS